MPRDTVHSNDFKKFILGLDAQRFLATFARIGPDIAKLHALIGGTAKRPSTLKFLLVFCRLFDRTAASVQPQDLTAERAEGHIARMCAANHHHITKRGTDFDLSRLYWSSLAELGADAGIFRKTIARLYARHPSLN